MRENTRMPWRYDDKHCACGEVESEQHALLYCNLYMDLRRRWKDFFSLVNVDVYNDIKGYEPSTNP